MTHRTSWMEKTVALAVVAVVGIAIMTAMDKAGEPAIGAGSDGPTVCAAGHGAVSNTIQPDVSRAIDPGEQEGRAEPTAICRLRPECTSDSDCDVRCGVGLGKCVHSNCPVRICRCS